MAIFMVGWFWPCARHEEEPADFWCGGVRNRLPSRAPQMFPGIVAHGKIMSVQQCGIAPVVRRKPCK